MAYQRKTKDIYVLEVWYGPQYGWEYELEEETYKAAREQLNSYKENCPQYPARIKKKRKRIEEVSA